MPVQLSCDDDYESPQQPAAPLRKMFPSFFFYLPMFGLVWSSSRLARRGEFDNTAWTASSKRIIEMLEAVGARLRIEGVNNIAAVPGPCVFIGNHMSTLETFVLPSFIGLHKRVTFVVKKSLVEYPVFRHIMTSRNPVVVERVNPREDFKVVMEEGARRIESGISIVVFPQTTRTVDFTPSQFNTIGIKLAKRAGVPVVPVALKTDAWRNGRMFKDFGPIVPSKTIHIAFGEPLNVEGSGQEQHTRVIAFIEEKLRAWTQEEAI